MVMPAVDLTGQMFGYLTILRRVASTTGSNVRARWLARCTCGREVVVIGQNLRNPNRSAKKSCGCRRGEQVVDGRGSHGLTGQSGWHTWIGMRSRCRNPGDKDWRNYGARGITVCERWDNSFEAFWEDMGPTHRPGATIERMDNSRGYEAGNCQWRGYRRKANNRRNNVRLLTPMGSLTVAQAARRYKLNPGMIYQRVQRGWPEHLLLIPSTR